MLLGFKPELHGLLRKIEREELLATIRLLLISVVLLPVLPDRGFGPWEVLNPYKIWWMVVLVAGISYAGYVAERIWGRDRGALVAGLLGGLVSSTAVTLELSRRAGKGRSRSQNVDATAAGIVVASTIMFVRQLAILVPVAPSLISALAAPVGVTAAVGLSAAGGLFLRSRRRESADSGSGLGLKNPLDLPSALGFGLLLAAIMIASRALTASLGDRGLYLAAALSGIADVDAITLSIGAMVNGGHVGTRAAIAAVLLAAATNTLVKSVIAAAIGGRDVGLRVVPSLAVALASGAATLPFIVGRVVP